MILIIQCLLGGFFVVLGGFVAFICCTLTFNWAWKRVLDYINRKQVEKILKIQAVTLKESKEPIKTKEDKETSKFLKDFLKKVDPGRPN